MNCTTSAAGSVVERRVELLKEQSDRLSLLLADPYPGLMTWLSAVPAVTDEIAAIMRGERD